MPPYSDDLYSADDSDDESFSEELSPTDGYFNQRDQSQNVLVPDPSIEASDTAESKAREAREELEALARISTESHQPTIPHNSSSHTPSAQPSQLFVSSPSHIDTNLYPPSSPATNRYTPLSPQRSHRQDLYSESSPLLYSTAPPAYSPSSNSSQGHQRNYSTITSTASQSHLEEGRLFPYQEPESMGQPLDEEYEPLVRGPVIPRKRRFVQKAILFLTALAVVVWIIGAFSSSSTSSKPVKPGKDWDPKPNPPMEDTPVDDVGGQYCPAATNILYKTNIANNFNEPKGLTVYQSTTNEGNYDQSVSVNTVGEIRIRRLPENSPFKNGFISAEVRTTAPNINVNHNIEHDNRVSFISPQRIQRTPENSRSRPCVSIEVTLWIPDGAKFKSLAIDTVTLNVNMFPGVVAHVIDETHIKTITGKVTFQPTIKREMVKSLGIGSPKMPKKSWWLSNIPFIRPNLPFMYDGPAEEPEAKHPPIPDESVKKSPRIFTSRKIYIETQSSSIQGAYSLYDYLHVTSISGSIKIDIIPQEEDPAKPAPAELYMHTQSSTIQGFFPFHGLVSSSTTETIPIREYKTHVETTSGGVKGRFLLGVHSYFKSLSGGIQVEVLNAYSKRSKESNGNVYFTTETVSGSTKVNLLNSLSPFSTLANDSRSPPPYSVEDPKISKTTKDREAIRDISSTHKGHSGSIKLFYPAEWEGSIVAQAVSGSVQIRGDGVVIDGRRDWVPKELKAHKGDFGRGEKGSELLVSAISGSVNVFIGE